MKTDGKRLEALVSFVEEIMLPPNFSIKVNERVYDDDGNQTAELDVQARGKVGTTEISWLIECRDRKAGGGAPISWIEQLVARRERLNFNKVTAVSTTGFSPAAQVFAKDKGIELRAGPLTYRAKRKKLLDRIEG